MATVIIKDDKSFEKSFDLFIGYALKQAQQIVYDCIQDSINEYYKEKVFRGGSAIPSVYERSYKLLNSLVKTDMIKIGKSWQCEVKIDESYLNYQYPGTPGWSGIPATGQDVLEWNNADGSHGRTVDGEWKIWEQAITALGGENGIIEILKVKLKKAGIPIV